MPSDTTYLFFQRDLQNGDDIARSRGPVIQSARVIRGPGVSSISLLRYFISSIN